MYIFHVDLPPDVGEINNVLRVAAMRFQSTSCLVVSEMPWLVLADEVCHFRVPTEPGSIETKKYNDINEWFCRTLHVTD